VVPLDCAEEVKKFMEYFKAVFTFLKIGIKIIGVQ
jgi:hypothetical protein